MAIMALPDLSKDRDDDGPQISDALQGEVLSASPEMEGPDGDMMGETNEMLMGLAGAMAAIYQELMKHTLSLNRIEQEITGQSANQAEMLALENKRLDAEQDATREDANKTDVDAANAMGDEEGGGGAGDAVAKEMGKKKGPLGALARIWLVFSRFVKKFGYIILGIIASLGMIFGGDGSQGGDFIQALIDGWEAAIAALKPLFDVLFNDILPALTPIFTMFVSISTMVINILAPIFKKLAEVVSRMMEVIAPIIAGIIEFVVGVLEPVLGAVGFAIGFVMEALMVPLDMLMGTIAWVGDFILDQMSIIKNMINFAFSDPINFIKSIPDYITIAIGNMFMAVVDAINWIIPDWTGLDIDPPEFITKMIGGAQKNISERGAAGEEAAADLESKDMTKTMNEKNPDAQDWAGNAAERYNDEDSYIGASVDFMSGMVNQMGQELGFTQPDSGGVVQTNVSGGTTNSVVNDNSTNISNNDDPLSDGTGKAF